MVNAIGIPMMIDRSAELLGVEQAICKVLREQPMRLERLVDAMPVYRGSLIVSALVLLKETGRVQVGKHWTLRLVESPCQGP